MRFYLQLSVIIAFVLISIGADAGTIRGYIVDKETGEQIVGAIISIDGTTLGTTTSLDGTFEFKNLAAGTYKLKILYVSYNVEVKDVTLTQEQSINLNVKLTSKATSFKEIEIKGKYIRGSEEEAQNLEKNGHEVMNVMSARAIALSPDITVSAVLQRVSGVSIENSNSGKQYVVIRGMDKKYNSTLVNGIKIPSPNDRDKYVPMDLFPADILERLEVIKTLTPSMEGDAAGGVVNLVMKNAPEKLVADANFGVGYSNIFQHQAFQTYNSNTVNWKSPSELSGPGVFATMANFPKQNLMLSATPTPINSVYGLTLGNRFLKNKLGVIVSGSLQNTSKGYTSASFLQSPTIPPAASANSPMIQTFSNLNYRVFSTLSNRMAAMTKLDYEFNSRNTLSLFATYVELDDYRVRQTADSQLGGGHTPDGYTSYVALHQRVETRTTLQNIANVTLQGKHKILDNFIGDWSLVASQAKQQLPDNAQYSYEQTADNHSGTFVFGNPFVSSMSRDWYRNTDKDLSVYGNLHYSPNFLPGLKLIDIGAMYRHKTRDNYTNRYSMSPITDSGSNYEAYSNLQNARYTFIPQNTALGTANDPGTYTFHENITGYYVQFNYDVMANLNLFGGVRIENTDAGYVSDLPVTVAGKSADYIYTDILPSLEAKYTLTSKSNIMAAYFRSIYRPAYGDLVPNPQKTDYEDYNFIGNPYLQHSVIDNIDIRYSIFPKGLDQVMVGVFTKIIQNPIEYTVQQVNHTETEITPYNFGTAHNTGFEVVLRKYFGSFGIGGNYTFTNSSVSSLKQRLYNDTSKSKNGPITDSILVNRQLVGQSKHIGNISLLYKNVKNKINAQLAFVYTGERINLLSPYVGLDVWQKPTLTLDFSAEKQFGKHFTVYVKANNLLNTGYELFIKQHNISYSGTFKLRYQESADYITQQKDFYKSSYLIGIRYKF